MTDVPLEMEQQLSKPERKNMDTCLRRLKQELLSMKEAGDGLHAQMNSMMGALQELKVLQVQTALENLDISGRPINRGAPPPAPPTSVASYPMSSPNPTMCGEPSSSRSSRPSLDSRSTSRTRQEDQRRSQRRSSLGTSASSSSSLESQRSHRNESNPESTPRRWSGYTAPQVDFCGPTVGNPPPEPRPQAVSAGRSHTVDLPGILDSLSREGPSLDGDYSQERVDDDGDWTSSLMSRRRSRQPLVLGDNVFADLVGNWLDLPELERDEEQEEGEEREKEEEDEEARGWRRKRRGESQDRPDTPAHPLRLSRSQEICRKFSLTANIFKKFLRSVRPDRDKLLKERPGWAAPELPEDELFKRPKKAAAKPSKGSFYLPFWATGQQGKGRPCPPLAEVEIKHRELRPVHPQPFSGIHLDRRSPSQSWPETMQPLFDYNTAVWV